MDRKTPFLNNDLPSIAAFPQDGKTWRVDWFGELAFPNRSIRRTQPSLLVHLSRVIDDRFHDDPSILLSPDSTSPARFQRKVWISVGTLPLLRIGDIWRDGKLESSPDYQLEKFVDVRVDTSTVQLIKAGLNLDDQGFLLPLAEHPWHLNCTHSYCVMIELSENRRIIIPCVELIRFYFGSSSGLITKLFLPPLDRKALYTHARLDPDKRRLVLDLAEKISGTSAADIGRMHLDPVAWRAAVHIGTSALKASVAGQSIYVQAIFPFDGDTTLVAAGKWLSHGDRGNSTFVVYSLRSCSHAFPFLSLSYRTSVTRSAKHPSQGDSNETVAQVRRAAPDSSRQCLVERDAANSLASKEKPVYMAQRFPDLSRKAIWKEKSISVATREAQSAYIQGTAVDDAAIGDRASDKRIRPVDLAILMSEPKRHHQAPAFLVRAIDEIRQLVGFDVELLTCSDTDGWTVPIPALSNDDGEIDLRLFIQGVDGILNLRRVAAFAVRSGQEHVSLVLIESLPLFIKLYATDSMDPDEVFRKIQFAVDDYLISSRPHDVSIAKLIMRVPGEVDGPT